MPRTSVDIHYEEYQELLGKVDPGEISLLTSINDNYRKSLILVAASYFEKKVLEDISLLPSKRSKTYILVKSFIDNQALTRKYHTLFDWKGSNANSFFALFGGQFKLFMIAEISADPKLETGIKSFLLIGNERNKMVHNDYGAYQLDKDAKEIYASYLEANYFMTQLPALFEKFSSQEG